MRLIDADALKELFSEVIGSIAKKPEMNGNLEHMIRASAMVIQMIDDAPTVQPKHGTWIPVTNGRGGHECDQCHNYAPSYQNGKEHLSDFCPHCGADMRTKETDCDYERAVEQLEHDMLYEPTFDPDDGSM